MLSAARCDACNAEIPLRGAALDFALPPAAVTCPGCRKHIATILLYRATWMEALVWKWLALASLPLAVLLALQHAPAWAWLLGTIALGGGVVGFVVSRMIAFPLTLITDRVRGIESET